MALFDARARDNAQELSAYRDLRYHGSQRDQEMELKNSTTLYVGNLSYYTREEQVYELFGRAGDVRRVIMGLDRFKKTPCGFCFVEYYTRVDAENAIRCVNGTRLDDRVIRRTQVGIKYNRRCSHAWRQHGDVFDTRTDWDAGFVEGRQYGRGKHGGQVRDEYRKDFDSGRGGWNKVVSTRNTETV